MGIELKHLRLLESIRAHGTISGAARALGYSQPAISQQLAHAEQVIGTPLVLRERSGAKLTEAGEILACISQPVESEVARAVAEVEAIAGLRSGRIRITCFPSAAATLLPEALASMRASHPGIRFSLFEREPPDGLEMLRAGECDIAIVFDYATADSSEINTRLLPNERAATLVEERIYVALPADHRLAQQESIDVNELEDEEWIAGCEDCRSYLVDMCRSSGYTPDISFETDDHGAVHGLVGAGLGVALLPALVVAAGRRSEAVSFVRCTTSSARVVRAITTRGLLSVPGVLPTIAALRTVGEVQLQVPGLRAHARGFTRGST